MPGSIIYRGPSMLDGTPIVVVAIYSSSNSKTGDMLQTYVLVDSPTMNPLEANKTGADEAICGNCRHRGTPTKDPKRKQSTDRSCYVYLAQGPLQVFKTLHEGKYPDATTPAARRAVGAQRKVRIGTYGDGAAAPMDVWLDLLADSLGHTGYSHQLHHTGAQQHSSFQSRLYMVSADNHQDASRAWAAGYRTFRIIKDISHQDKQNEALCPASKEAGHKSTCASCMLCGGNSVKAKSVAIVVHGTGATHFKRQAA